MQEEMTPDASRKSGGLLGILGFRTSRSDTQDANARPVGSGQRHARQELVRRIGDFLIEQDLEITASNLAIAHGMQSGLNPGLRRQIENRLSEGLRVTQDWLERAAASTKADRNSIVDALADKLEQGIDAFSRNTREARDTTAEYGNALADHVDQLETSQLKTGPLDTGAFADQVISELTGFARAMLERSREAEDKLRKSEEEAEYLRRNLAAARRDAEVDALTGLPNRRSFEATLEKELALAKANIEPLCIAFCDIDKFKAINDIHGHEAGDRILCVVGKALNAISGETCHIARHGGEEFTLLFRGLALQDARDLLDGVRSELAQRKLVNRRTERPFGQITFSGGIADIFAYANPSAALSAADEALYQAKNDGRNQICIATTPA